MEKTIKRLKLSRAASHLIKAYKLPENWANGVCRDLQREDFLPFTGYRISRLNRFEIAAHVAIIGSAKNGPFVDQVERINEIALLDSVKYLEKGGNVVMDSMHIRRVLNGEEPDSLESLLISAIWDNYGK